MFARMTTLLALASVGYEGSGPQNAAELLSAIETLQHTVQDFQCEYEVWLYYKGILAEEMKLGDDGLAEAYNGAFVWNQGDVRSDGFRRRTSDNRIRRETLVVRAREKKSEMYQRLNDEAKGVGIVYDSKEVNSWTVGGLGRVFLIDKLKRDCADESFLLSLGEDQSGGRNLKTLSLTFKGAGDRLFARYWIDMNRNGHVVRYETYGLDGVVTARLDVELAPFKLREQEIWMPASGKFMGFMGRKGKELFVSEEASSIETTNILRSTMEFNKRPGRDVFSMKYKPGTPISDNLKKLTTEYGQQEGVAVLTRAEAEELLRQQVAEAEKQKAELVVAPVSESWFWVAYLPWLFGVAAVLSSIVLWHQRRG